MELRKYMPINKWIDEIFDKAKAEQMKRLKSSGYIFKYIDISVKDRNERFRFDLFDAKKMETLIV